MYTELAKKTPNYNTVPNYLTYAANSGLVFFASLAFLLLILTGPYCFSFTRTYENSRVNKTCHLILTWFLNFFHVQVLGGQAANVLEGVDMIVVTNKY